MLGGTLDAPHETQLGQWREPRIIGGQTVEMARGDLIIVPRGTPRQRGTAGKDSTRILIKVFAEPVPAEPKKLDSQGKGQKP